MKTREELLANTWKPDEDVNIGSYVIRQGKLGKILNAPTEKQLDCPYCNEPFKALYSESDITYGIIDHKVYGVYADSEKLTGLKFAYCPMCGRKLGDK